MAKLRFAQVARCATTPKPALYVTMDNHDRCIGVVEWCT